MPLTPTETPSLAPTITIRALRPGDDGTPFRTLNEEWITRHFTLEPKDREVLGDPESTILAKGGHIFILEAEGEPAGCVALIPCLAFGEMGEGVYELSKMAVSPNLRGMGLGRRLIEHTIAHARHIGATRLFLGSSKKLANAVHLYESVGFRHVPPASVPPMPYTRADVFMDLPL